MIENIKGYSYNDLTIVPSIISNISSRSKCMCWESEDFLPIWASPMASVVSPKNRLEFERHGIHAIIPRNILLEDRIKEMNEHNWVALSLKEFEDLFITNYKDRTSSWYGICVDIANGHMLSLYQKIQKAKQLIKENNAYLSIMTGNIANPETYRVCEDSGVDYVRCGIGSGAGCITSSNTSVHYPMASLIEETYAIKSEIHGKCKIIADGGIRGYADIIKALALGADYVMIGSVFAKMLESSGKTYFCYPDSDKWREFKFDPSNHKYESGKFYDLDTSTGMWDEIKLRKEFYGMASAKGQIAISGKKTKTSEGLTRMIPVEYTMSSWTNNFKDYLRSAMSYTGSYTLEDFIGKQDLVVISENTYNSVNR